MRHPRLLPALLLAVLACGGDDGPAGPTEPTPNYNLAVTPATLTIVIGERGAYTVTVTRTGGFAGAVSVRIDELPDGVTVTPLTIDAGQTTGTLEVATSAQSRPGVFTLTVRSSATGLAPKTTDTTLVTRIVT